MGKRVEGKPKKKSIKTKAANLSSKRKLAKMGKKQKKGHSGTVVRYMTRSQALRKLQITLKDFRRLCILKGIYPRDPKKKGSGNRTSYYHVKDISYLANEPLLNEFRQFKAFMKKVRNSYGRGEINEARRKYENIPEMNLDHIVKERYPTFIDAIRDLDDPLSMIHLFARLPAERQIRTKVTLNCIRLCKEWQMWVSKSRSLRKVFVSIKGTYYQAEILGEKVTWVVPHQFSQSLPQNVDYRIMLTFLEFYQVLLRFVMYKLYTDMGLVYPPQINLKKEEEGGYLNSLTVENITKEDGLATKETVTEEQKEEEKEEESDDEKLNDEELEKQSEERIKHIEEQFKYMQDPEFEKSVNTNPEKDTNENDDFVLDSTFAGIPNGCGLDPLDNEEARAVLKKEQELKQFKNLFGGLYFFISREVPRESLEFIIRCFGGEIAWQGEGSPYTYADPRITHVIMDRPTIQNKIENREYVQPQWVFDSVNNQMLLPTTRYVAGATLPPHLSPFVDAEEEGYMTEYEKELRALKHPEENEEEMMQEEEVEEEVGDFEKELEMERKGISYDEKEKVDEEEKEEKKEKAKKRREEAKREQQEETDAMNTYMMPKNIKRLYNRIEYGKEQKRKRVEELQNKSKSN